MVNRSIFGKFFAPALLLLAITLLCAGCGKKVKFLDEDNKDLSTGQSDTTDTGTTSSRSNAFAQFQEEHKYTFQLMRFAGNIGRLEAGLTTTPLTQQQAQQVLALLQPLRTQSTLTQDQAKDTLRGLKNVLTLTQLTQIGAMKSRNSQGGQAGGQLGGGQGGGQSGGGGGGQQGNRPRMQFNPAAMKDFNPFNPPQGTPMASGRQAARWEELFADLQAKANGQPVPTSVTPGSNGGHMHHHHSARAVLPAAATMRLRHNNGQGRVWWA